MAKTAIKIEKGLQPLQARSHYKSKYPWAELEIGDAFAPTSKRSGYTSARRASLIYAPKKFKAGRAEGGKFYIWRVA